MCKNEICIYEYMHIYMVSRYAHIDPILYEIRSQTLRVDCSETWRRNSWLKRGTWRALKMSRANSTTRFVFFVSPFAFQIFQIFVYLCICVFVPVFVLLVHPSFKISNISWCGLSLYIYIIYFCQLKVNLSFSVLYVFVLKYIYIMNTYIHNYINFAEGHVTQDM